jgi:hypothetical protein
VKRSAAWALPTALLVAIPKCPMCVAAYVTLATGASISLKTAGWLRVGMIGACVAMLVGLVVRRVWDRATKRRSDEGVRGGVYVF